MFEVNDYIMYGVTGVCRVTGIEEKIINHIKKDYYVLSPVYSKNIVIKIPVDNEKVTMRKLHTKEEVESLINSMPNKETLWIDDDKERNETFKSMLKSADCNDFITLIKSIYSNKKIRKTIAKTMHKADDEIMKAAENLLNEEFATILGIELEEVTPYILDKIAE